MAALWTVEYVLGTPVKETRTYHRRTNTPRRCEECGSTRHVHKAKDMSLLAVRQVRRWCGQHLLNKEESGDD